MTFSTLVTRRCLHACLHSWANLLIEIQAGRSTRQRLVANENDENSNSTRITRAKAAALSVDELSMPSKGTKKAATTTTAAGGQRKRAALGDVSNYKKLEVGGGEGKKAGLGKAGLVSKAAQPSGIQKKTTTRAALTTKEVNKKVEKRSGSGSSTIGGPLQKRKTSSTTSTAVVKEELAEEEEEEPARKKAHTTEPEKKPKVESKKAGKSIVDDLDDAEVEPEEPAAFEYPPGVRDLDSEDLEDPLMVAEYSNEIFNYLRDLEVQSLPNPQYMDHQDDLEWKTRGILIDWLIEVHTRFHLLPETLFLAVNMIDRFLSEKVVQLDRLQLVGVTAMFIASKYEEVLSPHVANFRHVSDDGFTEAEILSAERFILSTLNYDLSYPNPMNFLRRISKADNYDIQCRTIGKYLMEISLLDHRFMAFRPSHVAAGAMYLARMMLDRGDWVIFPHSPT
jgi:G2/mitotic-specific cyclin 2